MKHGSEFYAVEAKYWKVLKQQLFFQGNKWVTTGYLISSKSMGQKSLGWNMRMQWQDFIYSFVNKYQDIQIKYNVKFESVVSK